MFNERVFEGTNYSVSLTGDLLFDDQNIITDYERDFIDQLLFLDDIKVIYVGRKQDDGFNRYYIECERNSVTELVENEVGKIYMNVVNSNSNEDWDIIDTVYKTGECESYPKDDICMWIIRGVKDKHDALQAV